MWRRCSAAVRGGRSDDRRRGSAQPTRIHISSLGYSSVADFGDQYSDLLGGDAGHQVKIPNPMYYIP
jgi:hypothetical protein